MSETQRMPVLFVGHGDPRLVLGGNDYYDAWTKIGEGLPRPKAILCVSAHWESDGAQVTAMERPRTIHDFYGFPEPMYQLSYPAPGAPELAARVARDTADYGTALDHDWGLDHGTWCILTPMFPQAEVPVFQLSLNRRFEPRRHYELGQELKRLRDEGVLIIGSGNIVHNLRHAFTPSRETGAGPAADWAEEFDTKVRDLILDRNHQAIWAYDALGPAARMAVPTAEHYLPLLYALAASDEKDEIRFVNESMEYGAISMRTVLFGA